MVRQFSNENDRQGGAANSPSPRWGEVGALGAPGEGVTIVRIKSDPNPLTPTLSPRGRGSLHSRLA
jgi:hypothetical protein